VGVSKGKRGRKGCGKFGREDRSRGKGIAGAGVWGRALGEKGEGERGR